MLRFKQFISEGGNVALYGNEQGQLNPTGAKSKEFPKIIHQAEPFDSRHREILQKDVPEALQHLHSLVQKQHGVSMFGNALLNRTAFHTGSTRSFFDPNISHKEYSAGIKQTGDIDVMSDATHQEKVNSTLRSLKSGSKLGDMTFVGHIQRGDETHVLLSHPEFKGNIQVDINHVDYDQRTKEPTEEAKFARGGGSFQDRSMGIKGVHHKMLLNSVAKIKGMKHSAKGLKGENDSPSSFGERNPAKISQKLFGVSDERIHSFSGVAGLIKEYIPDEHHQTIFDNFASSSSREPGTAVEKLRQHLGIK